MLEPKMWQLRDMKRDIIETGLNQSSEHEGRGRVKRKWGTKCEIKS